MLARALINMAIEFGPIVAFSISIEYVNFITAVGIFVLLTFVALIAGFVERGGFAWFPFIVAVSVIGFGLATILLRNPFFFIFKDTIYNGVFALLVIGSLIIKKPLLKLLFKDTFAMTDKGWTILTARWAVMFASLAIANEIVRIHITPEDWVQYKVAITVLTAIFGLYQFRLAKKYRLPEASSWGMKV